MLQATVANSYVTVIIRDIKMLENFIYCLKSCINCYRLLKNGEGMMDGYDPDEVYERRG